MKITKKTRGRNRKSRMTRRMGFTLMELMVALGVLSLVLLVLFKLFISLNYAFQGQEKIADLQQNSRFAMDRVVSLIRMAGYGAPSGLSIVAGTDRTTGPDELSVISSFGDSLAVTSDITLQNAAQNIPVDTVTKDGIVTADYKFQIGQKLQGIDTTMYERSGGGLRNKFLFRGMISGFPDNYTISITNLKDEAGNAIGAANKVRVPKGAMIFLFRPRATIRMIDSGGVTVEDPSSSPRPFKLSLQSVDPDTGLTTDDILASNIEDIQFVYYTYDSRTNQIDCYNCTNDPAYPPNCSASCPCYPSFDSANASDRSFLASLRWVKVNMVLSSSQADPKYKNTEQHPASNINYGNRVSFALDTGYYGRLLQSSARLRNSELIR